MNILKFVLWIHANCRIKPSLRFNCEVLWNNWLNLSPATCWYAALWRSMLKRFLPFKLQTKRNSTCLPVNLTTKLHKTRTEYVILASDICKPSNNENMKTMTMSNERFSGISWNSLDASTLHAHLESLKLGQRPPHGESLTPDLVRSRRVWDVARCLVSKSSNMFR